MDTACNTVASFAVTAFTRTSCAASKLEAVISTVTEPLTITFGSSVPVDIEIRHIQV